MALRAALGLPIMLFSNFDNRIADIMNSGMKYLALKNPSSYAKPEPIFIHKLEMFTLFVFFLGLGRLIAANVAGVFPFEANLSLVLQSTVLIIDLLFLIEFCARFLYSHQNQGIRDYWFTYHGWLDFLAVIPSLFLFSLPVAVALLTDFYIIDPLPVFTLFLLFKLPRILRAEIVVNLLLKVKKEKESLLSGTSMLGHHTRMILTIVVGSILTFATIADLTFLRKSMVIRDFEAEKKAQLIQSLKKTDQALSLEQTLAYGDKIKDDLISVSDKQDRYYIFHDLSLARLNFIESFEDSIKINHAGLEYTYSLKSIFKNTASLHLAIIAFTLFISSLILTLYTFYAYKNLAKPLKTIAQGLSRWDNNEMVLYKDPQPVDEVATLVDAYNHRWLPLKAKLKQTRQNKLERKVSKEQSLLKKLTE